MAFLALLALNALMASTSLATALFSMNYTLTHHMNKILTLSAGILVGTALGAVLPEGIETLVSSQSALDLLGAWNISISFAVGAPLLLGFITLFCVEHVLHKSVARESDSHIAITVSLSSPKSIAVSIALSTLTLGLLVHALADGVALGVSFLDDKDTFRLVFFVMIAIHKIPTAFSLAALLVKEGIPPKATKYHLIAFCLATPLASLVTYLLVELFNFTSPFFLGLMLLYSAGTFVYSIVHVMGEAMKPVSVEPPIASVQLLPLDQFSDGTPSNSDFLVAVIGMSLPLLFTFAGAD